MSVDDLKEACRRSIACGVGSVVLVSKSTRLCGRRGPIGELVCVNSLGEKLVRYDAAKILKFVEENEVRQ